MTLDEARNAIRGKTQATPQFIAVAKSFILNNVDGSTQASTRGLIRDFLRAQDAAKPDIVVVNAAVDSEAAIERAARYLSFSLSFIEALYSLIGSGLLIPTGSHENWDGNISYTTVIPGSGGHSGGWDWQEMHFSYPSTVIAAPSLWNRNQDEPPLENSIFVQDAVGNLAGPGIVEALSDAVLCMRQELHRPAVAMLGKAVEGAWIELGEALSLATRGPGTAHDKFMDDIAGKYGQFGRTIDQVLQICQQAEKSRQIMKTVGVTQAQMEFAATWSNVLRDARNAIHPTSSPAVPPTYEATYALMLGSRLHLSLMYKLRQAALSAAGGKPEKTTEQ